MSISSINAGGYNTSDANAQNQTARNTPNANDSAAASNSAPAAAASATPAATPEPSATVTLSANAQALATLASHGITVEQGSIADLGLPPVSSLKTPEDWQKFGEALASAIPHYPTAPDGTPIGQISEQDFEKVIANFGGTTDQADALFQQLDSDAGDSVSHSELLNALANTRDPSSAAGSALLTVMDQNQDGTVDEQEFVKLETALVEAEKAPKQAS
ncbi:hypothetical protein C7405_10551 [Paraburkholderia caballeronis]|uniref:EF-hand domain-containing protein n=1 Tax=Paraburkholderia caballeronis TaxID=416943 RepID=UPI0010DBDB62|nr:EF-hand domain-containing protein [Paraburkholderia caballeronis]TDV35561.1 hypothetical protein C7405_10551 [Paraburkholderia caballeronis]